ncbi:MAG: hypothetical protein JJU29_20730 [Verrucomicrobia bacterium]|nr:hypothetical protein [Verrucomicrobiota bacterium]MCH8512346.1 hypothetical protein [Kiritimatiellia bacterium]
MKRYEDLPNDFNFEQLIDFLKDRVDHKKLVRNEDKKVVFTRGLFLGVSVVHNTKKDWLVLLGVSPVSLPIIDLFYIAPQHNMEKEVEAVVNSFFETGA